MSDQTRTQAGPTNGLGDESRTEQAQQKAEEAVGKAQDRARQIVDERSTQAGKQVSTQAGDIRSVGEQLRSQGKDGPAKIADQAAERVERLGGYLTDADADKILGDVEDFARKNPMVAAFGGVALGFAASRFLKASSQKRFSTRQPSAQLPGSTTERYGVGTQPGGPPASPSKPAAPAAGLADTPVSPTPGAHV